MNKIKQTPVIRHKINTRSNQRELALPYVEAAFHDSDNEGLLPLSALSEPVEVLLKVWDGASAGDKYQLALNTELVGDEKYISADDEVGNSLYLSIPVDELAEGVFALSYKTTNIENGTADFSDSVRLEIDTTPPGRPQLGPVKFPSEVQGGLTSAELAGLGDELVVEIGSYTGMAKHDVIRTFWGAVEGETDTVTADDMGLRRVQITFSREFLEGLGEFDGVVTYTVTDRAGNVSETSLDAPIQLMLKEAPTDFPAPIIDPALGELIDFAEAKAGVNIDIPRYDGVAQFDQIIVRWGDNIMSPVTLPEGGEAEEIVLSLTIPFATVSLTPEGTVAVSYEVVQKGALLGSSLSSDIDVYLSLPGPSVPEAPIIQGTSLSNPNIDDNFIDEDDYDLNGRSIVKWQSGFQINDNLNLFWGQQSIVQWYQIKDSDVTNERDLILSIPNAVMKSQGTGAEIPVYYTVTRYANPNANKSFVQSITVRSKEELPGGPEGLNGPEFNTTENGVVGPIENPDGAFVKIAPYTNIMRDQILLFTFSGFDEDNNIIEDASFADQRELDSNDVIAGYSFKVPDAILRRVCRGYGEAFFKVVPAAGSNQSPVTSKTTRVRINMSRPATQCRARY
jgi:hypothetical protein